MGLNKQQLFIFFFFLVTIQLFGQVTASQEQIYKVPRVSNVHFDGRLDEAFWHDLESFKFIQFQPNYSDSTTEALNVNLVYDDDYLYLGGRLFVSDPDLIRGQTFKRDGESAATDYFGLVIDSYNDKENGLAFFTSPTGFRYDAAISNDAATENSMSTSWNTYWDAMTHITMEYCDVEIRIPWSSLKFDSGSDKVNMGVSIWRYMAAKNEMNLFPDISPDLGEMANWRPSQFFEVQFENISSSKPVYITPYALLGNQRENIQNETETDFTQNSQFNYNAGLDVKYNLTSNLTLDLTINTDFAQVESDDQQINLSRYEIFRPEKRQFFQERASLFDFSFNYVNHLFYSRNIGIDDGQPVPILGGLRMTGKVGDTDIGIINMQTGVANTRFIDGFSPGNLSDNFSVLRLKRQVLNDYSYVGGMITHKMDFNGEFNSAYGLDGVFRVLGDDYVTLKWAQTFENGVEPNLFSLEPARFLFGLERRVFTGFNYNFSIGSTGKDYNPGMGFVSRNNYLFTNLDLRYGYLFNDQSFWQRINFNTGAWADNNYDIGKIDQASAYAGFNIQSKNAWSVRGSVKYNFDILTDKLEISDDIAIPASDYHYFKAGIRFNTPFNSKFGLGMDYDFGQFFDGMINSFEFEPRYNPNAHLELSGAYELNYINFDQRNELLVSHIIRLRALYMLNAKFSISSFIQYNNESDLFISNLKLRYNPKEGNDLYIVFNEVLNGERDRIDPRYPLLNTEVFALKYTYTFKID